MRAARGADAMVLWRKIVKLRIAVKFSVLTRWFPTRTASARFGVATVQVLQ